MTQPAKQFAPWLGVFETLRVVKGVPLFMEAHREELGHAKEALGLSTDFDFEHARAELPRLSGRWRWLVTPEGTRTLFSEEEPAPAEPVALSVSTVRVGSCNWDARYKTVSYLAHFQAAKLAGTSDAVLLNEHGHIASASRGNIFWRMGDQIFTPAHESGCRRGVVRQFVLKHRQVKIGHFPSADLLEADEIFLTNSMKGIVTVNILQDRALRLFPTADQLREEYKAAIASEINAQEKLA